MIEHDDPLKIRNSHAMIEVCAGAKNDENPCCMYREKLCLLGVIKRFNTSK